MDYIEFDCPCGAKVIARFVFPTSKGKFALVGGCPRCVMRGDNKSSYMIYPKAHGDDIMPLLNMPLPVLRET